MSSIIPGSVALTSALCILCCLHVSEIIIPMSSRRIQILRCDNSPTCGALLVAPWTILIAVGTFCCIACSAGNSATCTIFLHAFRTVAFTFWSCDSIFCRIQSQSGHVRIRRTRRPRGLPRCCWGSRLMQIIYQFTHTGTTLFIDQATSL